MITPGPIPFMSFIWLHIAEIFKKKEYRAKKCQHPMYDKSRSIKIEKDSHVGQIRVCPECNMLLLEGEISF